MDATMRIQIAIARADIILCHASAALPYMGLAALLIGAVIYLMRRCV